MLLIVGKFASATLHSLYERQGIKLIFILGTRYISPLRELEKDVIHL
jgi:hypothetical protein